MKSSRIRCLVAAGLLVSLTSVAAERDEQRSRGDLVNVFLAPGNAQWLVGPIARMASEDEIAAYLAITEDEAAERFIDGFWARREPAEAESGPTARQLFEERAEEADRLYTEAMVPGRRTDRGTIFILYGPPDEVKFKPAKPKRGGRYRSRPMSSRYGQVEHWIYAEGQVGLHGRPPRRAYRFVRVGDLTRFIDSPS